VDYLKLVSRELAKYNLDLEGVKEVRWNIEPADDCMFFTDSEGRM
jgi:hypothetical protein